MTKTTEAVGARVDRLARQVLEILVAARQEELAARLTAQEKRERLSEATVVVAGEMNRGKSSLVNALVSMPGLCPVDFEATTNVHLVLRHSKEPYVRLYTILEPEGRIIDPETISDWTTESANPANHKMVRAVEIGRDSDLLAEQLVLVDTPGVGGIQAGHHEVTHAALGRADALIFVTDGLAPISSPELHFLARAAQSVGTIIFALTKTDVSRGWQELLEANRAILRRHLPQFSDAPYIPVSSKLELKARTLAAAGDADSHKLAAELAMESGFQELRQRIREEVIAKAKLLRDINRLQLITFCLVSLEVPERAAISAVRGDPGFKEALEADQKRLEGLRKENSAWSIALNDQTQEMRQALSKEINRLFSELRTKYDAQIKSASSEFLKELPQHLAADFQTIGARLEIVFEKELHGLVSRLSDSLSGPAESIQLPSAVNGPLKLDVEGSALRETGSRADAATMLGGATSAFFGYNMTTMLLGGILTVVPVINVIGGIGGMLMGTVTMLARRKIQKQQEGKALVSSVLADASAQVRAEVETKILRASRSIRNDISSMFDRRVEDVRAALARTQSLLTADQSKQQGIRTTAQNRLKQLQSLRQEAERCLVLLHEAQ